MLRILLADDIAPEGVALLRADVGVQFETKLKQSPESLAKLVGDYDGMVIRSGVQITAEVLAKPGRLRAIARAGVGVDNVDLSAATASGVLVMNTPDANTVSAAEHTIALMTALARDVPRACATLKAGKWDRKSFMGRELMGKTLGVIGLGRIGRAVAERAAGLKMTVLASDPFFSGTPPAYIRKVLSKDELLAECDFLSVHTPGGSETRSLIGAAELARMKRGAMLLNVARGGIIDETALAEAIRSGHIAGAGIDVFADEPPKTEATKALIELPQVIVTPHLGASTVEAQTAVSTEAVSSLLAYLRRGEVRGAVNLPGGGFDLPTEHRPYGDLANRMGQLLTSLCGAGIREIRVTYRGLLAGMPTGPLAGVFASAVLQPYLSTPLNLVNIAATAKARGIPLVEQDADAGDPMATAMEAEVRTADGGSHSIVGSVFRDGLGRILSIDGHPMEMKPRGHMALIFNNDQPGRIGLVGTLFGRYNVNIAEMTIGRVGQTALMVLNIDTPAPPEALAELASAPGILQVRQVTLPSLG